MRRAPLVAVALIGVGLVVAPFAFSMFQRGPKGAEVLDDFRPFMTEERIEGFQGHIALIDDAVNEAQAVDADSATFDSFAESWPAIEADMSDLLTKVHGNIGAYGAVDALPSFSLFPWFFVIPGAVIAVLGAVAVRRPATGLAYVLAGFGIALVLAPAVFGMFTRAPKGGEMMDDFASFMTRERVQDIQGTSARWRWAKAASASTSSPRSRRRGCPTRRSPTSTRPSRPSTTAGSGSSTT